MHRYEAFGLSLASERELPELPATPIRGAADVAIRWGAVPNRKTEAMFEAAGGDAWLRHEGIGRFSIRGGAEIVVEPEDGASERMVRIVLLGSAAGAMLHQRGLLPLHASAIIGGGRAVAFAGRSGIGKSTLVAHLAPRGFPILCDDVCVVGPDADGRWLARPGLPRIKLWRDAVERLGGDPDALERVLDARDKYHLPLPAGGLSAPAELAALYVLSDTDPEGSEPEVRQLFGAGAVAALLANVYRKEYLAPLGRLGGAFEQAVRLVSRTPVFLAPRRRGEALLEAEADRLARHFQALG